jgi:putative hydrolase of the HAD superfamily
MYDSGYVLGTASEPEYWALVKLRTGVTAPDHELREEILSRFVLRPWMLEIVRRLRNQGYIVGILSDQTDWLDQLDQRDDFFKEFNHVFNSYHLGMSKRGARVFSYVVEELGVPASKVLFIDDHDGNLERARSQGLRAILYRDREAFVSELQSLGVAAFGTAQQGPRFDKKKDDADVE